MKIRRKNQIIKIKIKLKAIVIVTVIVIQIVKLKVNAKQANYLRDLKIHRSQQEVERNDEYSIFKYYLRPTFDFQQELLWNADKVEVLEPKWLREEMAERINDMLNLYHPINYSSQNS